MWAHPPEQLNTNWVGERVATIKFGEILSNVINRKDAPAWGPNAQFRYPINGTGHIWRAVFAGLPQANIRLNAEMVAVHDEPPPAGTAGGGERSIELKDGSRLGYDALLSTAPVDLLLKHAFPGKPEMAQLAGAGGMQREGRVGLALALARGLGGACPPLTSARLLAPAPPPPPSPAPPSLPQARRSTSSTRRSTWWAWASRGSRPPRSTACTGSTSPRRSSPSTA